jgi:hypothetical protein
VYPLRRTSFLVRPYSKRENRNAVGGLTSLVTVVEDDGSFSSSLYGVALRGFWGRNSDGRNTVNASYEREIRDYTTQNQADSSHIGRTDTIAKYGLFYDRNLGQSWGLTVSAYRWDDDVSYPDGTSRPYTKTVVAATVGYRFRRPL